MADTALCEMVSTSFGVLEAEIEDVGIEDVGIDDAALETSLAELICRFESRESRETKIARLWATLDEIVRDPAARLP